MVPRFDSFGAHKQEEDDDSQHWKSDHDLTEFPAPTPSFDPLFIPDDDFTMIDPYPSGIRTRGPGMPSTETLITSTYSGSRHSAYSNRVESTTTLTPVPTNEEPLPSATDANGFAADATDWERKRQSHGPLYAAAGIVPVVVLVIIGAVLFCMRKRKKQRRLAATQAGVQEMKARNQPTVQAHVAAPPVPTQQPSYTAPPSHPPPASPASLQPVILGPITSGSNGNYFTGIDTSDVVSVTNGRAGLGDPFADGNSINEEPPPPYRPRSIAPLSRDTSLRVPPAASSQTNLMSGREQPMRSPFADPQDDDVVSDISGPTLQRSRDDMSIVSDLSYQRDPVVGRPAV